jgi:low affinity Fe/Cu permease
MIGYSFTQQIKDIIPGVGLALAMAIVVFGIGLLLPFSPVWVLSIQLFTGIAFVLIVSELLKIKDYVYLKTLTVEKIKSIKAQKNGKIK